MTRPVARCGDDCAWLAATPTTPLPRPTPSSSLRTPHPRGPDHGHARHDDAPDTSSSPRPTKSSTSPANCRTTTCTPRTPRCARRSPAKARRWAETELNEFGAHIGTAEYLELGALANRFQPELDTHDRFGNRVDLVKFHPAYHALMKTAIENGLHSSPWSDPRPGAHVARAAKSLHALAGRSGPRLPDHDDLRGRAGAARRSRTSPHSGSR